MALDLAQFHESFATPDGATSPAHAATERIGAATDAAGSPESASAERVTASKAAA
jgi:hypothetical protein